MSLLFVRRTARPPLVPFIARGRKLHGTKEPSTDFTMMLAWVAVTSAIRMYNNLEYMAEKNSEVETKFVLFYSMSHCGDGVRVTL